MGIRVVRSRLVVAAPSPPTSQWPTPGTTGVLAGTTLTDWAASFNLGAGTYEEIRFTDRVNVTAGGTSAHFINCSLEQGINNFTNDTSARHFTVTDCTIGLSGSCLSDFALGSQNFDALRCEIYGEDGIRWSHKGWVANDPRHVIEDCFIDSCATGVAHGDGFQADFAEAPLILRHCTFDMRATNSTASVFWGDGCTVPVGETGAEIDDCLFVGDGEYGTKMATVSGHSIHDCVYVGMTDGQHNDGDFCGNIATFTNNRFGTMVGDFDVTVGDLVGC